MVYSGALESGREILVIAEGEMTSVTVRCASPGQQQSQGLRLETGEWRSPPELFRTDDGFAIRVSGTRGDRFVRVSGSGLAVVSQPPLLANAARLSIRPVEKDDSVRSHTTSATPPEPIEPINPMEPMEPMKPLDPMKPMEMKMGGMEMRMDPMEMRMGDMVLRMNAPSPAKPCFCSQCGHPLTPSHRFCSDCGAKVG